MNSSILVFGATGGIGAALARLLASRGARLHLVARRPGPLETLAGEIGATWSAADATDAAATQEAVDAAIRQTGRLDGMACCVGSLLLKPAHLTTDDEWSHALAMNLTSAFITFRACVKAMRQQGGAIVLVSSVAASRGLANHEAIAAAKAGVTGLTLSAAATYAPSIRVNAVAPGLVRTPLTQGLVASEAAAKASSAMHPLKRLGEPADAAAAIAWLLSPEAAWVTGQILGVDGGLAHVQAR